MLGGTPTKGGTGGTLQGGGSGGTSSGVGGSSGPSSTSGGAGGGPSGNGGVSGAASGVGGASGGPSGVGGGSAGDGGSAGTTGSGSGGSPPPPDAGATCRNPQCSDGSCSRLAWNFDSGNLDGIVVRDSSGQPLEVRTFQGSNALAVDVGQLNAIPGISFTLPICNSGTADLSSNKLTFRVYFEGTPASSFEFYVQAAVPDPTHTNTYLDQIGPSTGAWADYASPLSKSAFGSSVTEILIQAGSLGGAFSGTIWFDDFAIQ
jgi:hypothetical protein